MTEVDRKAQPSEGARAIAEKLRKNRLLKTEAALYRDDTAALIDAELRELLEVVDEVCESHKEIRHVGDTSVIRLRAIRTKWQVKP